MDHAAPLPDEPSMASPDSTRHATPPCAKTPRSPTVRTSPRPRDTPNPQARLLQLRNAGFRGSAIAGRRVSPIFTSPCALPDSLAYPIHDENAPRTAERRTLYGEDLPPNPVNILQEIHNSTRRKRQSPTLGFGEIFQDRTPDENIMGAPSGNSYHNRASSTCSPSPSNVPRPKMSKLRENHWTKSPPPISPPVAKPLKGRRVSRVNIRSTSLESATYIEHLESQLAAANAKLDSIMSPTTNKTRAAKLRALSNESRSLRQEVSNWETKFEQRVREQIDRRDEIEAGMRSHIQILEEEMEMKDAKLKELEWELDNTRNKVREMEGLEEINKNLERRIDVLTDLVAQSPTKLDLGSPTSSPTRADPVSRAQRRRSMLPKVQSSPGGVRLSLNTATDSGFWSSKRGGPHSGGLASRDGTNCLLEEEEGPEKATERRPRESLSSGSSASFPSMPFSFPRPQSIHSISSVEFPSPELPSPSEADSQTKSISRQRRMRRFPSGLCTLKPLILPKATGTPIPASAPVSATSGSSPRHISNDSLDPTIAFLSKFDDRSSVSTPVQRSRQRSATWAQEETLKILERNSKASSLMDDDAAARSLMSPIEFSQDPDGESETDHPKPIRARPLSLEKELELANMLSPNDMDDAIIPADAEEDGMLGSSLTVIDDSHSETPLTNQHLLPPTTPSAADITPKARGSDIVAPSPPKSTPVDACRKGITLGIFTRLTSLIHRVKQDPVGLAQRLLCNAWTLGSARLGGAGWWLLVEDYATGNFHWDHLSAKTRRRMTASRCLGDRSGVARRHEDKPSECSSAGLPEATRLQSPRASPLSPFTLSRAEPHSLPCDACVEPSSRRTFRLWFHFSLAIVLAVGLAIKHGPGSVLMEQNMHASHIHPKPGAETSKSCPRSESSAPDVAKPKPKMSPPTDSGTERKSKDGIGSYHVTFAPNLGPAHFEGV